MLVNIIPTMSLYQNVYPTDRRKRQCGILRFNWINNNSHRDVYSADNRRSHATCSIRAFQECLRSNEENVGLASSTDKIA